jgi:hypothetical protein
MYIGNHVDVLYWLSAKFDKSYKYRFYVKVETNEFCNVLLIHVGLGYEM